MVIRSSDCTAARVGQKAQLVAQAFAERLDLAQGCVQVVTGRVDENLQLGRLGLETLDAGLQCATGALGTPRLVPGQGRQDHQARSKRQEDRQRRRRALHRQQPAEQGQRQTGEGQDRRGVTAKPGPG